MKLKTYINVLGCCQNPECEHIMTRNVEAFLDDRCFQSCECPECHKGTVYFGKMAVHHRPDAGKSTSRLVRPGKETFKRMKSIFQWGLLTVGMYVMIACELVLRYGDLMTPVWRYLLAGGLVLVLAALWILLSRVFDRASALDWENAHSFLPED